MASHMEHAAARTRSKRITMPVFAPTYLLLVAAGVCEAAAVASMVLADAAPMEDASVWMHPQHRMAMLVGAFGGLFFSLMWCWEDNGKRMSAKIFSQPLLALALTPVLVQVCRMPETIEWLVGVSFVIGAGGTAILHKVLPFWDEVLWPAISKKFKKRVDDL